MAETFTGGCLCGAVRYRARGPLRPVIACHCRQCRRSSGHYVAATAALREALDLEDASGALRWYRSSTQARRGFCAQCGSSL
ncbi:MAG: GFA family protein, partial [Candidatus Competibacterales bacterium]|nr:GFA family protein [Candidatus Competibacterales bacterium]